MPLIEASLRSNAISVSPYLLAWYCVGYIFHMGESLFVPLGSVYIEPFYVSIIPYIDKYLVNFILKLTGYSFFILLF